MIELSENNNIKNIELTYENQKDAKKITSKLSNFNLEIFYINNIKTTYNKSK